MSRIFMYALLVFGVFLQPKKEKLFDFSRLDSTIDFIDVSYPNGTTVYKDSIEFIEQEQEGESNLVHIKLSDQIQLTHLCNDLFSSNPNNFKTEYLKYEKDSVSINKLFSHLVNEGETSTNYRILFNKMIYQFNFKEKQYVLLGASNRQFFRNIERNYWVLLEVAAGKIKNSYVFSDAYDIDADCFGDFDKDGNLDYLNWNFNQNHIALYTLYENKFEKNKTKYFYVSPSAAEQTDQARGMYIRYSILDPIKSKWFYELED